MTHMRVVVTLEFSEAKEIFENFFLPVLVAHIADETNRYAAKKPKRQTPSPSHMREWFDTTPDEMSVFLAMIIIMGIMPKPDLKLYWTRNPVFEIPFFPNTMHRDRFMALLSNLHFTDNSQADTRDRLYKVRPVIDTLTENFKSVFLPDNRISTDESLWKFKERLKFKQFNPIARQIWHQGIQSLPKHGSCRRIYLELENIHGARQE
ncbi:piggyBac transposable element-derived protein 4-like [Patiria miniata]|uniref:PiggyBac transposable element-derived protein domain-containing protein n=1 Tax=Patiria miniata TaxID=46514 RepID=A0A913ZIJ6_PATMI|nr:piggyBac transposable element-derived protein 4-like [Patiria miniata]